MANLENNNDKEKKTVTENLTEKVQETVKEASELASDAITHPVETAGEFGKQAVKDVTSYSWWAKLLLILFWTGISVFAIILIAINLPVTKRYAADKALEVVNKNFKAQMSTESVDVDFFGDVTIKGLRIKDYKGLDFIKARVLKANSDWFTLAKNAISGDSNSLSFNSIYFTDADIKVITYEGDSIANFIRFTHLFDSGKKSDPNKPPFEMDARIEFVNSKLSIINRNSPGDKGKWLYAENLNLVIPKAKVNGGNVSAQINNLKFVTTRWGKTHVVDTFSTDFALTDDFLLLKDLTLNTDHSLLQGNLKFNLNHGSWAGFEDKVRWDMDLMLGSQVSGYDISYFVTNWDNYKPINISGKMTGPLNKIYLENFVLKAPSVNIATSNMKLENLLNGKFNIETNNLSTDLTYKDLKAAMPSFISKKMKNFADDFGKLKFNGAARLTPEQIFIPKGNLITGIGQAKIDKLSLVGYSSAMPKYSGYVEVNDLNTSVITKSKAVGLISGKFNITGQSFDVNTMKISTKSQISKIEIMDKTINNLTLDGLLDHRKYNGLINVNDEQAKATVKGLIDFSTKRIAADVNADVKYLNINYFTGKPGAQTVSGNVVGKIAMTDINDLTADIDATGLHFSTGKQNYDIAKASVKTFIDNGNRVIEVNAPSVAEGRVAGKFNLADMAGMVQNGLGKILVGPEPRKLYKGQHFAMNFDVQQGLLQYFMPELQLPSGATVVGEYDGTSNNLVLNLDAASLTYIMTKKEMISDADKALAAANPDYKINERQNVTKDSAMVDNVLVRINTANLEEQIYAKIGRVKYNKNILKDITLSGRNPDGNRLYLATNFDFGSPEDEIEDKLKHYAINVNQTTNQAGDYIFRFDPTSVNFNNVAWSIDTSPELDHTITYRQKTKDFEVKNLRVLSENSELFVHNGIFKSAQDFSVDAEVKNFAIEKLMEMQSGGNTLNVKGLANGSVKITMNNKTLAPLVDLNVTNIVMNDKDMGDILLSAKPSDKPNVFDIDGQVKSAGIIGDNNLHVKGTLDNNSSSPILDVVAEMREFDLAFTQQFVKTIFGNFRGKASGDLKISGKLNDLDYSGDIALKGFGLKLLFTGVDYSFDDTVVPLSKGLALLNNIQVHDGRSNSKGDISGYIRFETLSSMEVALYFNANNLLVLNSTQKDNDLFWGRVYGQGELTVSGPVSGLSIETSPQNPFKALSGSTFTFNSGSTSSTEEFKMLRFMKTDKEGQVLAEKKKRTGANMNVDFNLDVDKGTTVNVLIGDGVGNIQVKGVSKALRFQMSRQGAIAMNGTYLVDNGIFKSSMLMNKTFQIENGSSIHWDGNAMTPTLDITANYRRTVANAGEYLNMGKLQPIDILLQAKITQTLNDPDLQLHVTALDVSSQIKETLASKMSREGEEVMQFSSILLLNSFNVSETGAFNVDAAGIAESSAYNMVLKQASSALNTISNKFQIDLNYIKGDENAQISDRANAGLNIAVSPRVTLKGGLGIPIAKNTAENTNSNLLSGEGSIEYDVSKKNDGSLVLRAYSKPSNIGMVAGTNGTANQAYGGGVVWSKSFNSFFKKNKKNKNSTQQEAEKKNDSVNSEVK